jgi:hypothetical protein
VKVALNVTIDSHDFLRESVSLFLTTLLTLLPFSSGFSSSRLLCKNVKIKAQLARIPTYSFVRFETWYLALRKEHRSGVSVNRGLRRY